MPTRSTLDRRKRSASPSRDDRRDRRRRHEENFREKPDDRRRDFSSGRSSNKRPLDDDLRSSKYQKSGDRSRRFRHEDDDDGEEKPARSSRFVGERKYEDFRRTDSSTKGRDIGLDAFGNQRQSFRDRDRSDAPPQRRDDYEKSNYDGGYRNAGGGGYSRRGQSFARWNSGRGRGTNRGRSTVYRPGEDDEKPTLNLFDPTQVPKGRGYFEHEDRLSETNRRFRGRGRGRFTGGSRGPSWQPRSRDYRGGRSEDVWTHDMYDEMETNDVSKGSAEVAMEERK